MTQIPEFNFLKSEIQINVEYLRESIGDGLILQKPTQNVYRFRTEHIEISETELLMMNFEFNFKQILSKYDIIRTKNS